MTNPIYPCIWFDGQAKEAVTLYCSIFDNSKIIAENSVTVIFEINGKKVVGLNGGPIYTINPSVSFFIHCSTIQETDQIWSGLIDRGKALMPLDTYPWSKRYGWVQDKFGMTWQIMLHEGSSSAQTLTPSLLFTANQFGKAEEAIRFYSTVFENSKTITIEHYPKEDTHAGKVMFSEFHLNDYPFIAMDGPGVNEYSFNEGVSFIVECETQDEIDHYWNTFTKEGEESMCGWCKDKFGVSWQIIPGNLNALISDPEKGQKITAAFLKMKKLDINTLLNV